VKERVRENLAAWGLRTLADPQTPAFLRQSLAGLSTGTGAAGSRRLGALTSAQLAALAVDPVTRALLEPATEHVMADPLLELLPNYQLEPSIAIRLSETQDAEVSQKLRAMIAFDQAGAAARVASALRVAAQLVGNLVPSEKRAIFDRCLSILNRPADPYERYSSDLLAAAREAASAFLVNDSTLDEPALDAIRAGPRGEILAAVQSALKARAADAAPRFRHYVRELSLRGEALIRFAEACDAGSSILEPLVVVESSEGWQFGLRVRAVVRRTGAFVLAATSGPVLAAVLAEVAVRLHGRATTTSVDSAVAVGLLAVLAAVHILSVQLAISRRPAVIARATVVTPLIAATYSCCLSMVLVATLFADLMPPPSWHPGAVAAGLLVVTSFLIVWVAVRTVRDTGTVGAETVLRRSLGLAVVSGHQLGELQGQAAELEMAVERHAFLRSYTSVDQSSRRQPLCAKEAGYLSIDFGRLSGLAERPSFRDGRLRLEVVNKPGSALAGGIEYASLVPVPQASLVTDDYRAASRAFAIVRHRELEHLTELSVALVDEAFELSSLGDTIGAQRLINDAVALLRVHEQSAERARFAAPAIGMVASALQSAAERSLQVLNDHAAPQHGRELAMLLLRQLIGERGADDGFLVAVSAGVSGEPNIDLMQLTVVYEAAVRAVQLRARTSLSLIQRRLHRLAASDWDTAQEANELAGRLVQYIALADPPESRRAWSAWWEATTGTPAPDRSVIALRVGAAAWRARNMSLAVEVAQALESEFDWLQDMIHRADHAAVENLRSEMFGRLLGADAEQRMEDFLVAARDICG
jgi:hypothetical protein